MANTITEKVYIDPDIFQIDVPLPNNPLKNLNCYIITTPEQNLIIDTGFNLPESKQALLQGLADLEIDMDKTDIYATHMHADHTGLIGDIQRDHTLIYMNPIDYAMISDGMDAVWEKMDSIYLQEGFPMDELQANRAVNPARSYIADKPFHIQPVHDKDPIQIGPHTLTVLDVPGHTPGNTCLYLEKEKILFTGDHILFDITPNIVAWPDMDNALATYLESLHKISKLEIHLALPAHRGKDCDVYQRIKKIYTHHEKRLENTMDIVKANPGANAYEIASHMAWSMRGKNWQEAPIFQRWFAVGETISHLDYLLASTKIVKKEVKSINRYYSSCL